MKIGECAFLAERAEKELEAAHMAGLAAAPVKNKGTAAPVEEVAISRDLWLFLKGEAPMDGFWFGEYPIGKPHYWWRSYMKQRSVGCDDAGGKHEG
jgi:hypothetical protein